MADELDRVSPEEPCAICGKSDYCYRLAHYHVCTRVESNRPHAKSNGWLHKRDAAAQLTPLPKRKPRPTDAEKRAQWEPVALSCAATPVDRRLLAVGLGVNVDVLTRLLVGYSTNFGYHEPVWTFPERNADGWIVGIRRRTVQGGKKLCCTGARPGLTYADDWYNVSGPLFLVEGSSDTAACMTMGLRAIGRPSNLGGVEYLLAMLSRYSPHQRIVVLGENDRKSPIKITLMKPPHPRGCQCCGRCWPGKWGMLQTAQRLANGLCRPIGTAFCPDSAKDVRSWLNAQAVDVNDKSACQKLGKKFRYSMKLGLDYQPQPDYAIPL